MKNSLFFLHASVANGESKKGKHYSWIEKTLTQLLQCHPRFKLHYCPQGIFFLGIKAATKKFIMQKPTKYRRVSHTFIYLGSPAMIKTSATTNRFFLLGKNDHQSTVGIYIFIYIDLSRFFPRGNSDQSRAAVLFSLLIWFACKCCCENTNHL